MEHEPQQITMEDRPFSESLISAAKTLGFAFIAIILMAAWLGISAQDSAEKVRVETNLVLVNLIVRDKSWQFVRGLNREQIDVFVNNKKQPIESFSAGDAPVSFGVVYDMHPTTADRTKSVIESLRQFSRDLPIGDDIFLVAFNMRGTQAFDFIPAYEQLEKFMADPEKRNTRSLYDALYSASDRIRPSRNQKRVLLIISDSADHHSRHSFSELREKLEEIKAEVYAVIPAADSRFGYEDLGHKGRERYPFARDASALDRAALQELTLKNGGGTYFGGSQSTYQLYNIYRQIGYEMRAHYTLGFYPDVMDEKEHAVRVRVRDVKGSKDFVLTYRMTFRNRVRPIEQ